MENRVITAEVRSVYELGRRLQDGQTVVRELACVFSPPYGRTKKFASVNQESKFIGNHSLQTNHIHVPNCLTPYLRKSKPISNDFF